MRSINATFALSGGALLTVTRTDDSHVSVAVTKGKPLVMSHVNVDDIDEIGRTCGKVMEYAYGNPTYDSMEWGSIYKVLFKFRTIAPPPKGTYSKVKVK